MSIIRDAPCGQICRRIFGPQSFRYQDEMEGFRLDLPGEDKAKADPTSELTPEGQEKGSVKGNGLGNNVTDQAGSSTDDIEKAESPVLTPPGNGYQIVGWYDDTDVENPLNWSTGKKTFTYFQICLLTFAVCSGSAIITPAQPIFIEIFGVSGEVSSLVLSMYVLGYGVGPLFFSPLSEMPRMGRNIPYFASLTLFIVITAITSRVSNFPGLVVLSFLQGFLGGPVLATGGASAADLFSFPKIPYGLAFWGCAALAGLALAPLLSGFSAPLTTWRWSMYELLIMCSLCWLFLFSFLPETNADFILLNRAKSLRASTGNANLRSESEIKQGNLHFLRLLGTYLTTPFLVTIQDPSIAFINVYTGLIYGIFYSFFESFPLVYKGIYGYSTGIMGVVFLAIIVACFFGVTAYLALIYFHYEPYTMKSLMAGGIGSVEHRLLPGVIAAFLAPGGIFIFAWCSREDIIWIAPTTGIVFYMACVFNITMAVFIYLPMSYPRYSASLFAANSFLRSAVACAAIHFSQPLFGNLGVGKGCSLLGGLTFACFFGIFTLWKYGKQLRARSKFAQVY